MLNPVLIPGTRTGQQLGGWREICELPRLRGCRWDLVWTRQRTFQNEREGVGEVDPSPHPPTVPSRPPTADRETAGRLVSRGADRSSPRKGLVVQSLGWDTHLCHQSPPMRPALGACVYSCSFVGEEFIHCMFWIRVDVCTHVKDMCTLIVVLQYMYVCVICTHIGKYTDVWKCTCANTRNECLYM